MNKSPAKVSMLSPEVETQREYYANTADDYDQMHLTVHTPGSLQNRGLRSRDCISASNGEGIGNDGLEFVH